MHGTVGGLQEMHQQITFKLDFHIILYSAVLGTTRSVSKQILSLTVHYNVGLNPTIKFSF